VSETVDKAAAWLESQVRDLRFGEVTVKLVLHEGRVSRIEKTITEKEQPGDGRDHVDRDR
jgi:hypothetical protein